MWVERGNPAQQRKKSTICREGGMERECMCVYATEEESEQKAQRMCVYEGGRERDRERWARGMDLKKKKKSNVGTRLVT